MNISKTLLTIAAAAGLYGLALWNMNSRAIAGQTYSEAPKAPELVGTSWLNTPGEKPISLASRQGKVTIVEFWTFGCSNCRANLPAYARWAKQFAPDGVQLIGVHTPELENERDPKNVAAQVKQLGISYPVLLDAKSENWNRWKQRYWPTIYIVDGNGRIREKWEGELQKDEAAFTAKIQAIVDENKASKSGKLNKVVKTDAEWRQILTPQQYDVMRHAGTEAAFSGDYQSHGPGTYYCAACGQPLFDASTKFDSGTGWPSFYKALTSKSVEEKTDTSFGMSRTEVLCARCGGHLGHVFDDGPAPTGLRYCMNSVALKFVPQEKGAKK